MRNSAKLFHALVAAWLTVVSVTAGAVEKEWTFMVFLNGHNNLDSYGTTNMKQMEKVGSSADLNIVVQWASMGFDKTKRLLVQKSTDPSKVTSPVVQELPRVDMGDYNQLVEFVRWTVANYPAKHYFIDVWNHGSGWHRSRSGITFKPFDISNDDFTNNKITTVQLGQAMDEAAKIMGHKVDVIGFDACLMGMVEVAHEIANSVNVMIGSEETEPARGWPYDLMMARWAKQPKASGADLGRIWTEEMINSYTQQRDGEVTLSAIDLTKLGGLVKSLGSLGSMIAKLGSADASKLRNTASNAQTFAFDDYVDIGDLMTLSQKEMVGALPADVLTNVTSSLNAAVISNKTTKSYSKATGLSIWLPKDSWTHMQYSSTYDTLKFQKDTNWHAAVNNLL